MALVKCKECEKEISDKAEVCVHCGMEQKKKKATEKEMVNEIYQINTVPPKSGFVKNNIIPAILIFIGAILLVTGLSSDYYGYSDPDAYDTHVYPREKYINGDAYNYMIEASIMSGEISGGKASNAIHSLENTVYDLQNTIYICSGLIIVAIGLTKMKFK